MLLNLTLPTLIARIIVLMTAFSVHEFAHAFIADRFGDVTPRMNGRLTLNPLRHLDPMGSLMLLVAGFGWARPVEVNPYALQRRSPAALMWVSLAGPMSNLLMALLAAIPFRFGLLEVSNIFLPSRAILPSIELLLFEFITINLILMLFNLIPLAPLDGEKIADYFFPPVWSRFMDRIRPYSPIILLVLVFIPVYRGQSVVSLIIGPPMQALLLLLVG